MHVNLTELLKYRSALNGLQSPLSLCQQMVL
jgi:hypothetical protein